MHLINNHEQVLQKAVSLIMQCKALLSAKWRRAAMVMIASIQILACSVTTGEVGDRQGVRIASLWFHLSARSM